MLAGRDQDHWREWLALARLASLALEEGRPEAALAHCHRLRTVTERMKGGSEGVKTEMLETLAAYATGRPADVEGMLRGLRDADSHADLAWAQVLLAEEEVRRGRPEPARAYAQAALTSAEIVGRPSEAVIAHGILAAVDGPGKRGRSRSPAPASDLTARARRYLEEKRHGHSRSGADV